MGLVATFQKAAVDAFLAFGDVIAEFSYTDTSAEAYSTDTGVRSSTESTGTFEGALTDYKNWEIGGLIEAGDRRIVVIAEGLGFTPNAGDTVTLGTDTWTIVRPNPVYAGSTVIIYDLQVRI